MLWNVYTHINKAVFIFSEHSFGSFHANRSLAHRDCDIRFPLDSWLNLCACYRALTSFALMDCFVMWPWCQGIQMMPTLCTESWWHLQVTTLKLCSQVGCFWHPEFTLGHQKKALSNYFIVIIFNPKSSI